MTIGVVLDEFSRHRLPNLETVSCQCLVSKDRAPAHIDIGGRDGGRIGGRKLVCHIPQ